MHKDDCQSKHGPVQRQEGWSTSTTTTNATDNNNPPLKTHNTMSVSIILRDGESIQDAMARAKTNILKQKAETRSDQALNLSMDELNAMFNHNNAQS